MTWDVPYFSEQLKQQRYSISDELLRPYFPEQQVLNGLFEVVKRLFGMTVSEQKDVKTWHEHVRFSVFTTPMVTCVAASI